MEWIKIQSKGEIEPEAFSLIGASSKRNDSTKIGFFGSGLKYSIAALLRNKIDFKVFCGKREIIFSVVDKQFRGETFGAICIDGVETSLTTTMGGSDWDLAFAPFREIYSNALDEDEDVLLSETNTVEGKFETTTFLIKKTPEIGEFYRNIFDYFCLRNPNVLYSNDYFSIYPKAKNGKIKLFRKGILCYEGVAESELALFSYNSPDFTINESRVLSNQSIAKYQLAKGWKTTTDEKLISQLLDGLEGSNATYYEHMIAWDSWISFSSAWFDVCKNMKFVPVEMVMFCKESQLVGRRMLPKSLLLELYRKFPELDILGLSESAGSVNYVVDENPPENLVNKVLDAIVILNDSRYGGRMKDLDIHYAKFEDERVLGLADKGKTILSTRLEDDDVAYIAKIIIEENEHNRSGCKDETRAFQNHLLKLYYDELISK